ncbi:MAG: hypothetical protein AB4080_17910 [Trichodesmium sp.]
MYTTQIGFLYRTPNSIFAKVRIRRQETAILETGDRRRGVRS